MDATKAIDKLLKLSRTEECIVLVQHDSSANIRWANTTITTNGQSEQTYLAIFAIQNSRVGSVITSLNAATDLEGLLRQAEARAELGLPAFDATTVLSGGSTWSKAAHDHPSGADISCIYQPLADCFGKTEAQKLKLFGYSETRQHSYWVGTSRGLRRSTAHSESTAELNLKTPDFKTSVWSGMVAHDPKDLNLGQLFKTLEQKMEWSKHSVSLPAGKYETILEASAVADLLIYNYWSSAARDADEGRSVYRRAGGKNAIGEKLFDKDITIYSDPQATDLEVPAFEVAFATGAEQSIFDNGAELDRTDWIKNGVLEALITPRYWAKKQKTPAHPVVTNLIFDHPGGPDVQEMIAKTKRGLLVTCLWYIREVDPQNLLLTGLTRDGVFLIENGEVVGAVNNFRFNMSPVDTLKQVAEIGASQITRAREFGDYFTFAKMPPLRVKDFNMSTVSDAI